MMKKALSLVVAISLLLTALVGCSAATPLASAPVASTPAQTVVASATTAEATKTPEPVKLVYWLFGSPTIDADQGLPKDKWYITGAISRFEAANPGITIELLIQPQEGNGEKFKAAGIAQNGPDFTNLWTGNMLTDNKQFIEPLDSYFTQEEKDNFLGLDACRDKYSPDGALLGIPSNNDYLMMFYNKDIFKQAGIEDSALPTDMASLSAACEKIKAINKTPIVIGNKEGWQAVFFLGSLIANSGGEQGIRDILDGKTTYSASPSFVAACKAWQDLYTKGYVNKDAASMGDSDATTKFIAGNAGMVVVGQWLVASALPTLGDKLGMIKVPNIDAASPNAGTMMGGPGACMVITSYSKHKEEAVKFLKFLISKEEAEKSITDTMHGNGTTALKYVSSNVFTDPFSKQLMVLGSTSTVIPYLDNQMPADVSAEFYRLTSLMLTGKMTVEEFTAKLDEAASKVKK